MTAADQNIPAPRAVLADDERLMREQLRARLAEVWPELQIVAEAKNGLEAVQLVQQHRPDIVFLDIRMPHIGRIQTLPAHHVDPFDRLLVAQALEEKLPIATADPVFSKYGVKRIW